ncbi:DsbA family protein [Cypionkella sp.]|uniref:DsbA family protein n=1 Tax=Cypionkella sp. TaxID=2811411 RepID=UPI00271D9D8E|nr:DsbA family protein [Cypionkella sp.]MDO8986441.1 DsbA family protein [Cypionkella sp.]MDP2048218.1 DsbA family protein [Cypionkella sp.]
MPGLTPFRELETAGALSTGAGLLVGLEGQHPLMQRKTPALRRCALILAKHCLDNKPTLDCQLHFFLISTARTAACWMQSYLIMMPPTPAPSGSIRHALPLLGAASTVASQAVLAADQQGGYQRMHDRLMRTRLVTDLNLVMSIADQIGLDGRRLLADMQTPEVAGALDQAKAIASVFGFYGTPSTVIGRTVFLGAIPAVDGTQIIKNELAALPLRC